MTAVDRSFCPNECMGRGLCLELNGYFRCLCDDELDNCEGAPVPQLLFDSDYWIPVGAIVVLSLLRLFVDLLIHCLLVRRQRPVSPPELVTHIPLHSSALELALEPPIEEIPL